MFDNLKLNTKLVGGFLIVALISLVIGIIGIYAVTRLTNSINEIATDHLPSVKALLTISIAQLAIDVVQKKLY